MSWVRLPHRPIRILLVEDSDADATLVRRALVAHAIEIARAKTCERAAELLADDECAIDAVLLDLGLGDSNGPATFERLFRVGSTPPIIVLTGVDDADLGLQLIQLGAEDYLPKCAVTRETLPRVIRHALERHRSRAELEKAQRDAQRASEAKSQFVAAVSHEIRTPLNAILGMAEILGRTALDEQQREYVSVFRRASHALISLINNVLDLSRLESGRLEIAEIAFDLREAIGQTVETFAFAAHKKSIALAATFDPSLPTRVLGDPDRLRQVVANLLGNAVKFTEAGSIIVRTMVEDDRAHFCIDVEDTGIGIPAEACERIFEPFEQASGEVHAHFGGTGLGLALSREIVERSNGTISAHPRAENGSIFRVRLPLTLPAAVRPASPPQPHPQLAGATALLAISSGAEREIVAALLRRHGAHVVACGSRTEAEKRLEGALGSGLSFDLAIVDARLREGGGLDLVEWIETSSAARRSLALLPMDHRAADPKAFRALGAAVLMKPVDEERLIALACGSRTHGDSIAEPSDGGASLDGMRVLLVDDSPDNQLVVAAYLGGTGCSVTRASDGQQAIDAWSPGRFDVVLMDVHMPVVDGREATRRIRAREAALGAAPTPIVALTADAFAHHVRECLDAGCDEHLAKPIERARLIEVLARHRRRASASDPAPSPAIAGDVDPEIADLVPGYVARRREELAEWRSALAERDFGKLRRLAHNMKGTGRSFGLPDLSDLGGRLEQAALAEKDEALASGIDLLAATLEAIPGRLAV